MSRPGERDHAVGGTAGDRGPDEARTVPTGTTGHPVTFADTPALTWVWHRGGAAIFPECSYEAFEAALAMGASALEADCYRMADGFGVLMHDRSIDRTTNSRGLTSAQMTSAVAAARLDPSTWFAPSWPDLEIPTLYGFLHRFGGRALLCLEAKGSGSGKVIADAVVRFGLQDSVYVYSFYDAELVAAVRVGLRVMRLFSYDVSAWDWAEKKAALGWHGVSGSTARGTSWIADAKAAGLRTSVWMVNSRAEADAYIAAGIDEILSDDVPYVSGSLPRTTSAGLSGPSWPSGLHGNAIGNILRDRGSIGTGGLRFAGDGAANRRFLRLGNVSFPAGQVPVEYTVTVRMTFDTATRWDYFALAVGFADDRPFDDRKNLAERGTYNAYFLTGYNIACRLRGDVKHYRINGDGTGTDLAPAVTVTGTPEELVLGTAYIWTLDVSPTTLSVRAPNGATYSAAEPTYRSDHPHPPLRHAAATFWSVTVEPREPGVGGAGTLADARGRLTPDRRPGRPTHDTGRVEVVGPRNASARDRFDGEGVVAPRVPLAHTPGDSATGR